MSLPSSMADFVPRDRLLQMAYCSILFVCCASIYIDIIFLVIKVINLEFFFSGELESASVLALICALSFAIILPVQVLETNVRDGSRTNFRLAHCFR